MRQDNKIQRAIQFMCRKTNTTDHRLNIGLTEIIDKILDGRKVPAIKLTRAATGWSLRDAKDFVDELGRMRSYEAHDELRDYFMLPGGTRIEMEYNNWEIPKSNNKIRQIINRTRLMPREIDSVIKKIVDNIIIDRRIEAIKLTRAATGWGLKESKEFTDELREMGSYELHIELQSYFRNYDKLNLQKKTELEFNEELL